MTEKLEDLDRKLDDPEIRVEKTKSRDQPEKLEIKVKEVKHKRSTEEMEELELKIDKLKDKLKLVSLALDRKSADLEIKIGKVDERFKEVAYDYPKLRERSEEIESLLQVINLGLTDFKRKFTDIDSRISKLEKVPEEVERRIVGLDNKLKKQDEDVKRIYLRLDEIGKIKQDVTKDLEIKMDLNTENIRKEITDNKAEIGHLKNNLDSLSFAVKSFERTVELTNLDDMIRRFNAIDKKILIAQSELDKLRDSTRDTSRMEADVETLKRRFKQMIPTIMDALNKINKFEVGMDNKMARVEAMEKGVVRLGAVQSMTDTVIEQVKKMNEIKTSMQDLYGKMSRIYDSKDISWDRLHKVVQELSELDKLKKDLEEVRSAVIENRSKIKNMKG